MGIVQCGLWTDENKTHSHPHSRAQQRRQGLTSEYGRAMRETRTAGVGMKLNCEVNPDPARALHLITRLANPLFKGGSVPTHVGGMKQLGPIAIILQNQPHESDR